jgi:hypothetical protein
MTIDFSPGCKRAKPTAGPIKGAVQGEATITARTPVKKEDRKSVLFLARDPKFAKLLPKTILPINTIPMATNR